MDLFLILFCVVVTVLVVIINTKVLFHFQEADAAGLGSHKAVKFIIVFSLSLGWLVVLLLPVDVRNSQSQPPLLDMEPLWITGFSTLIVFLLLVVVGTIFYHEVEDDDAVSNKCRFVLCRLFCTYIITFGIVAISYAFLAHADLPMSRYTCGREFAYQATDNLAVGRRNICDKREYTTLSIKVNFGIYMVACLCFLGWFFVVIFGGIGLSAIPIDLILGFKYRPRAISEVVYKERRAIIGKAASVMMDFAEAMKERDVEVSELDGREARRKKSKLAEDYNKFKCDIMLLEEDHQKLLVARFQHGENLAVAVVKLLVGIVCAILSLAWVLHILLYVIIRPGGQPTTLFLNGLLEMLEGALYPVGVSFFAVFVLYLPLCVLAGCLKFGMRLFFISIHPMRYKDTPLISILFNVEMLLICSGAVVQLALMSFADYARRSSAHVIFSAQIKYMWIFRWFFENDVFIYTLLAWSFLAFIYLLVKPRDAKFSFDKGADRKLLSIIGGGPASPKGRRGLLGRLTGKRNDESHEPMSRRA